LVWCELRPAEDRNRQHRLLCNHRRKQGNATGQPGCVGGGDIGGGRQPGF
jgi:hypothetical protein